MRNAEMTFYCLLRTKNRRAICSLEKICTSASSVQLKEHVYGIFRQNIVKSSVNPFSLSKVKF